MMDRSALYEKTAADVKSDYSPESAHPEWWRMHGRKWRNRVGYPRLIAESALFAALGLVRSINRGVFRNQPEEREAYDRALGALDEATGIIARANYRRFQGKPPEGES